MKTFKFKSVIISFMLIITAVILCACGRKTLSLDSLKSDGKYQYADAKWGISVDEAKKTLPFSIVESEYLQPSSGEFVIFESEKKLSFDGNNVTATFEFADNKLRMIQFLFEVDKNNYKETFDKLYKNLTKLYGKETTAKEKEDVFSSVSYYWEIDKTDINLGRISGGNILPTVAISLADKSQFPDVPQE